MSLIPWYHRSVVSRCSFFQVQRTCINHKGKLGSLNQWSSNSSLHQNHLEGLLKCRVLGPHYKFLIQLVWGGAWKCISNQIPTNANAADPRITFWDRPRQLNVFIILGSLQRGLLKIKCAYVSPGVTFNWSWFSRPGSLQIVSSQLSGDAKAALSSKVGRVAICCTVHG